MWSRGWRREDRMEAGGEKGTRWTVTAKKAEVVQVRVKEMVQKARRERSHKSSN